MNPLTAKKAIEILNRRVKTIAKLFGTHSPEYEIITNFIADFDFYESGGVFKLRNTKANRAEYRRLIPAAKRIQKTHVKVLERKARKQWQQARAEDIDDSENFDDFNDFGDTEITDLATYNKWLSTFETYFESCYELATLEGYSRQPAYDRAEQLYNDKNAYNNTWNYFYNRGEFDDWKNKEETESVERAYAPDNNGELKERTYNSLDNIDIEGL